MGTSTPVNEWYWCFIKHSDMKILTVVFFLGGSRRGRVFKLVVPELVEEIRGRFIAMTFGDAGKIK